MFGIARITAVCLLVTMAAAWPGDETMILAAAPSIHPAGCHGDQPASPPTLPTNFQCCAGGHREAIPSAAFSPPTLFAQIAAASERGNLRPSLSSFQPSSALVIPTNSPPGTRPLRV